MTQLKSVGLGSVMGNDSGHGVTVALVIFEIIQDWIIVCCNSRVLIGLSAMIYEQLYHA